MSLIHSTIDEIISYLRIRPLKDAERVASVFVATYSTWETQRRCSDEYFPRNAWCVDYHTIAAAAFLNGMVIKAPVTGSCCRVAV